MQLRPDHHMRFIMSSGDLTSCPSAVNHGSCPGSKDTAVIAFTFVKNILCNSELNFSHRISRPWSDGAEIAKSAESSLTVSTVLCHIRTKSADLKVFE